jgi:hypothetical protein
VVVLFATQRTTYLHLHKRNYRHLSGSALFGVILRVRGVLLLAFSYHARVDLLAALLAKGAADGLSRRLLHRSTVYTGTDCQHPPISLAADTLHRPRHPDVRGRVMRHLGPT